MLKPSQHKTSIQTWYTRYKKHVLDVQTELHKNSWLKGVALHFGY